MQIPFTKMVGTGNDFVVLDSRRHHFNGLRRRWPAVSRALCDRHTGIGADGVLLLEPARAGDVRMRIFNADGSEAEMCGNGARCVAQYLAHGAARRRVTLETRAGRLAADVRGRRVAIQMMEPTALRPTFRLSVGGRSLDMAFINTGVPHVVVPVKGLDTVDVVGLGRALRFHRAFAPRGTNVNFIQADSGRPQRIRVRTYERGVEGETLACGTGMVASAILYALGRYGAPPGPTTRRGRRPAAGRRTWTIEVIPRSGDRLTVSFAAERAGRGLRVREVVLEGEAVRVFDGAVGWPLRRN